MGMNRMTPFSGSSDQRNIIYDPHFISDIMRPIRGWNNNLLCIRFFTASEAQFLATPENRSHDRVSKNKQAAHLQPVAVCKNVTASNGTQHNIPPKTTSHFMQSSPHSLDIGRQQQQ
uniref:Uncharacterized protein n=1 Tax=Anopheles melas TaxID=34690 RepID=A0A182UBB0_9DIPT